MEYQVSDGETIYYRVIGKGFPIVFLHGNNLSGNYFAKQGVLYREYQLIFIDSRNHGRSSRKPVKMTFEQMAYDVKEVLDHLKIAKALFVGHSDGANLAMVYASHFPHRIAGLLLNSGNMTLSGLTPLSRLAVYGQNLVLHLFAPLSSRVRIWAKVSGLMLHDLQLDLTQLGQAPYPVWVVVGQHDLMTVEHSRAIAELFLHHRLIILPGQGHRLAQRVPQTFNQLIRELAQECQFLS